MIGQIESALKKAFYNQPDDFLLATKQEDYLTYRISSELNYNGVKSIFPTQFKRFDFVEINSENNHISRIFEAKFNYSSDFSNLFGYGEKCVRNDFEKLSDLDDYENSEKYLIQFIVHFNSNQINLWNKNLVDSSIGFNFDSKYFTYLNSKELKRFNPNLLFRNSKSNIYSSQFVDSFVAEINSYNLAMNFQGYCKFDFNKAIINFATEKRNIPHEFYCFLWKMNK